MALLKWAGYQGLSMSQAMPYLQGEKHGKIAVITFDDGYGDNVEAALPVLQKHGFCATSYVVSQAIGKDNFWDKPNVARKAIMTREQLLKWHAAGMEVGGHTQTHPKLSLATATQQLDEIRNGKEDLESIIQAPVTQFCYPYGDYDETTRRIVETAGFVAATTIVKGRARPSDTPFDYPRIYISGVYFLPSFILRVFTRFDGSVS